MARALRVCPTSGCPELLQPGQRCPRCAPTAERARGTATQRGYDARWRRVRAAYLRAHPICECGCGGIATDVDHIDGLGPHGPRGYDPANLRSLTHACHSRRTAADQPGGWAAR